MTQGHGFDRVMESANVQPVRTPFRAPNANAYAERWVRSIRRECISHLIFFGLEHLREVVRTYARFHCASRPHQGLGNRTPESCRRGPPCKRAVEAPAGKIVCKEELGGLLRSYYQKAA